MTETVETHEFGAEVGHLLDLVVHSLYSDREIFLRELVANAADATDRRRFEALTDLALAPASEPKVRIVADSAARTVTISDGGLGMTKDELAQNLGTIARSGTRAFSQSLAADAASDRPQLIGNFGVGFYSAFMVADRVEVTSRRAGQSQAWTWASDGRGRYTLSASERAEAGTDVVLHIKSDAEEFLQDTRLETIVRKWADHMTAPVVIMRDGEEVAGNEATALWRKPKSEIDEEAYTAFYHRLGFFFDKPWATLHWRAEGATEFTALLFVPGSKPFEAVEGERESKVRLHVRRMFITDKAELLPKWLRFVQGVVDTEDLPLNVSREMLQSTPVLTRIRRSVTGRVLSELTTRSKDAEDYAVFWENFGAIVKEGIYEDHERRNEIAPLLRFRSSAVEGLTGLSDYVARMKDGQEAIYYLIADDPDALNKSPQVEGFRARGLEVLLFTDQVDAFWPEQLGKFEEKALRSITQGAVDLARFPQEIEEAPGSDVSALITALKAALLKDVSDVRTTDRLVESAIVLAAPNHGPDLHLQRLLRRAGRESGSALPVLEINPRHPLIQRLAARVDNSLDIAEAAGTLLDLARVQDGDAPRDPMAFSRRIAGALADELAGD